MGYRSAGHAARRLNQHLQIESVGEAPLNLSNRVARQGKHGIGLG
jgi:hypothetical protein